MTFELPKSNQKEQDLIQPSQEVYAYHDQDLASKKLKNATQAYSAHPVT